MTTTHMRYAIATQWRSASQRPVNQEVAIDALRGARLLSASAPTDGSLEPRRQFEQFLETNALRLPAGRYTIQVQAEVPSDGQPNDELLRIDLDGLDSDEIRDGLLSLTRDQASWDDVGASWVLGIEVPRGGRRMRLKLSRLRRAPCTLRLITIRRHFWGARLPSTSFRDGMQSRPDIGQWVGWAERNNRIQRIVLGWIVPSDTSSGIIVYGPYIRLQPGQYEFELELSVEDVGDPDQAFIKIDLACNSGNRILGEFEFFQHDLWTTDGTRIVVYQFDHPGPEELENFEIRVWRVGTAAFTVRDVRMRKIELEPSLASGCLWLLPKVRVSGGSIQRDGSIAFQTESPGAAVAESIALRTGEYALQLGLEVMRPGARLRSLGHIGLSMAGLHVLDISVVEPPSDGESEATILDVSVDEIHVPPDSGPILIQFMTSGEAGLRLLEMQLQRQLPPKLPEPGRRQVILTAVDRKRLPSPSEGELLTEERRVRCGLYFLRIGIKIAQWNVPLEPIAAVHVLVNNQSMFRAYLRSAQLRPIGDLYRTIVPVPVWAAGGSAGLRVGFSAGEAFASLADLGLIPAPFRMRQSAIDLLPLLQGRGADWIGRGWHLGRTGGPALETELRLPRSGRYRLDMAIDAGRGGKPDDEIATLQVVPRSGGTRGLAIRRRDIRDQRPGRTFRLGFRSDGGPASEPCRITIAPTGIADFIVRRLDLSLCGLLPARPRPFDHAGFHR